MSSLPATDIRPEPKIKLQSAALTAKDKAMTLRLGFSCSQAEADAFAEQLSGLKLRAFHEYSARDGELKVHIAVTSLSDGCDVVEKIYKARPFRLRGLRFTGTVESFDERGQEKFRPLMEVRPRHMKPLPDDAPNMAGFLSAELVKRTLGDRYEILEADTADAPEFFVMDKSRQANTQAQGLLQAERSVRELESRFGLSRSNAPAISLVDIYRNDLGGDDPDHPSLSQGVCLKLKFLEEKAIEPFLKNLRRKYPNSFNVMMQDNAQHELVLATFDDKELSLGRLVSVLHIGMNCELPVVLKPTVVPDSGVGYRACIEVSMPEALSRHRNLMSTAFSEYVSMLVSAKHQLGGEGDHKHLLIEDTRPSANEAMRLAETIAGRVQEKLAVDRSKPSHG